MDLQRWDPSGAPATPQPCRERHPRCPSVSPGSVTAALLEGEQTEPGALLSPRLRRESYPRDLSRAGKGWSVRASSKWPL